MALTPEQIAKANTEHAHQAALFCWRSMQIRENPELHSKILWMHAIPNGGLRHKATAGKLKAEGATAGISDIFLPYPICYWVKDELVTKYHGLYLEMKKPSERNRKNKGCSDKQQEFLSYAATMSYAIKVAFTWTEARDTILTYLDGSL